MDKDQAEFTTDEMFLILTRMGFHNDTGDIGKPQIIESFQKTYPAFIFFYALLVIVGTVMNFSILYHIIKFGLHNDPTCGFLINVAITDIIKCLFTLPISLAVMLINNWIFGQFLCYFLPILQDAPSHVSTLTHLLIAYDRYRFVNNPRKPRIPTFVCALGTWLFTVCIVLPYPVYTTYVNVGKHNGKYKGVVLCLANLEEDINNYMRGLFILTYIMPLSVITYYYVKTSRELEFQEGPSTVAFFTSRGRTSLKQDSSVSTDVTLTVRSRRRSESVGTSALSSYDACDVDLDIAVEKRTQKYLSLMVGIFAACFTPLMFLKLAKLIINETYHNSAKFDVIYTIIVWTAFLPVVTTPGLYAFWQMNRFSTEGLRGCFRFSSPGQIPVVEDDVPMSARSQVSQTTTGASGGVPTRTGSRSGNGAGSSCRGSLFPRNGSPSLSTYSSQRTSSFQIN